MPATFVEIGRTGLRQWSGYITEEFLRELRRDRAAKMWREMGDNDDICGACLNAIEQVAGQVDWSVVPAESSAEGPEKGRGTRGGTQTRGKAPAQRRAEKRIRKAEGEELDERGEFLRSALFDDMDRPFRETIREALSMLQYGFAPLEICYKRRVPSKGDPAKGSRFDDARVGWEKWAIRSQYSIKRWEFDEDGGLVGLYQTTDTDPEVYIPIEKVLLFRASPKGGNPESKSILRNAFVDYFLKRRIREVEGIGIERNLAGLPVLTAPENEDWWNPNDPLASSKLAHAQKVVTTIRMDEQGGLVLPFGTKLELLSGQGGGKSMDTNAVITRYDQRIAMTMLADFILVGHDSVGSKALTQTKVDAFMLAMTAFLDHIEDLINRVAIPRLWKLNGWPIDATIPRVKHGEVNKVDLGPLGTFLKDYAASGGALWPNTALEAHLHDVAGFPAPPDGFEARQLAVEEAEAEQAAADAEAMAADRELQLELAGTKAGAPPVKAPRKRSSKAAE